MLPPARQALRVRQIGDPSQGLAHGLKKQTGVRGEFDVRLYHEAVTAHGEAVVRTFFFTAACPAGHFLIDAIQQFRRE